MNSALTAVAIPAYLAGTWKADPVHSATIDLASIDTGSEPRDNYLRSPTTSRSGSTRR